MWTSIIFGSYNIGGRIPDAPFMGLFGTVPYYLEVVVV